jgi:hypothetical protein
MRNYRNVYLRFGQITKRDEYSREHQVLLGVTSIVKAIGL